MLNTCVDLSTLTTAHLYLLNSKGYFLKGRNAEEEWGFLFDDRKELTFENRFPDAWSKVKESYSGQFMNEQGLFTHTSLYPLSEASKSIAGLSNTYKRSAVRLEDISYYWKIISHAPPDVLTSRAKNVEIGLGDLIHRKNLSLSIEVFGHPVGPQEEFMIQGEKLLCYSMFANLIKNALEASSDGETVTITLDHSDKGTAIIRIQNNGTVPTEMREKFFDKYSTSGKYGGTGLGTYSASLLAKTLNGQIEMTTSETDGTTIIIQLPVA